jgi:hypothetical protein
VEVEEAEGRGGEAVEVAAAAAAGRSMVSISEYIIDSVLYYFRLLV